MDYLPTMDPEKFADLARSVMSLKMYPYFDTTSYIIKCVMVREDRQTGTASTAFSRKHPLSSWVASMLMCFAGSILSNLLVGESLLAPFKNHNDVLLASAVWYVINYCPFDLAYKLVSFSPIKLVIHCMKQISTVHKIHHGVNYALKNYPGAYLIACIVGVTKGAGHYYMNTVSRLVRGIWIPTTNDFLHPSFAVKSSLAASVVFVLESRGYIHAPHISVYCGVLLFFIYFTLSSQLLGVHDPFVPFENLFGAVFFGGLVDGLGKIFSSGGGERERPAGGVAAEGVGEGAGKPKAD